MQRRFEGIWIPAELWATDHPILRKPARKCLIAEIASLDNGPRGCYATNAYFAKMFELSSHRVSRMISEFRDAGLVRVEIQYYEGSKQVKERNIFVTDQYFNLICPRPSVVTPSPQKQGDPPSENAGTPPTEMQVPSLQKCTHPPCKNAGVENIIENKELENKKENKIENPYMSISQKSTQWTLSPPYYVPRLLASGSLGDGKGEEVKEVEGDVGESAPVPDQPLSSTPTLFDQASPPTPPESSLPNYLPKTDSNHVDDTSIDETGGSVREKANNTVRMEDVSMRNNLSVAKLIYHILTGKSIRKGGSSEQILKEAMKRHGIDEVLSVIAFCVDTWKFDPNMDKYITLANMLRKTKFQDKLSQAEEMGLLCENEFEHGRLPEWDKRNSTYQNIFSPSDEEEHKLITFLKKEKIGMKFLYSLRRNPIPNAWWDERCEKWGAEKIEEIIKANAIYFSKETEVVFWLDQLLAKERPGKMNSQSERSEFFDRINQKIR